MKDIKWKEFFLEKGEIVGLAAAGALALLLLVATLIWPGKRLFVGSAKAHAAELKKLSDDLDRKQKGATPRPEHEPGPVGDITKTYEVKHVDPAEFPTFLAFFPPIDQDRKRQRPEVLVPEEFRVAFFRAQLPRMVLVPNDEGKFTKVWVLKNAAGAEGGQPGTMPPGMTAPKGFPGRFGSGSMGQLGQAGGAGQRTLQSLRRGIGRRGRKPIDLTDKIELVDIATAEGRTLATEALAQRMILVEASFPYKKQVQEFMDKLRLTSHGAVLTEQVKGEKNIWNSFQFRGMVIERTTLDHNGKEGPWERLMGKLTPNEKPERQPFDLYQVYNALRIQLPPQNREEKDADKLQPILAASRGLVMKIPAQYDKKKAPKLEEKLTTIQETIKKLEESGKKPEDFTPNILKQQDPFDLDGGQQQTTGTTPATPPVDPGTGYGSIKGDSTMKETPIDYCLIRFIDPSAEAGKTYKYRIKVKMANPNYSPDPEKRTDTYPHFAQAKELVAAEWATTPAVSVPADEFLYTVDEAKLDPKKWGRVYWPGENKAVFQIHRWVDSYPTSANTEQGVGDWLVAMRFFVERGEYVRTPPTFSLEVPVHRLDNPQLTLDFRPGKVRNERIPLPFGDDSVLVDLEGGDRVPYKRTVPDGEKTKTVTIEDKAPIEVLIMRPDGKMIAHNNITDAEDAARKKRYKSYLDRVDEAKNGPKKSSSSGAFDTP